MSYSPFTPAIENSYDNARQDVREDAQRVEALPDDAARAAERGYDNTVDAVKNAPSELSNAVSGAAKWLGDKIGGVEGEGRKAEESVDRFGQGVENSYDQGEQQGRQQGW